MIARRIATTLRAALALATVGACARPPVEPATSVSASGVTLTSTSIALPEDAAQFPPVPGADLLDANCTGCHSASMVLSQPPLKPEQWRATLTKMREVYKAPIAERDVPALLGTLAALGARPPAPSTPP